MRSSRKNKSLELLSFIDKFSAATTENSSANIPCKIPKAPLVSQSFPNPTSDGNEHHISIVCKKAQIDS